MAIFFKYRNNPANERKKVSVLGANYILNTAPISPIAKIALGEQTYSQNQGLNQNASGYFHQNYWKWYLRKEKVRA